MTTATAETSRMEPARETRVYTPAVDIFEHDHEWLLLAEMPGVDEKSAQVTVEKGILTLEGKVDEPVPEGYTLARAEYDVGRYLRAFEVSDRIDPNNVRASLKNGVLRVTLPKREEAKPKRIEVTVE